MHVLHTLVYKTNAQCCNSLTIVVCVFTLVMSGDLVYVFIKALHTQCLPVNVECSIFSFALSLNVGTLKMHTVMLLNSNGKLRLKPILPFDPTT